MPALTNSSSLIFRFAEVESRTQGSRPRPRTKDTGASALKKKGLRKFFQAKKVFKKFYSGDFHLRKTKQGLPKFSARFLALSNKISTVKKIVLSSIQGQGNFRGLETSRPRPRPRTLKSVLEANNVFEDSTYANLVRLLIAAG